MRGRVLGFSKEDDTGLISTEAGKNYTFTGSMWKADIEPEGQMKVDFEIDGTKAKDILLINNYHASSSSEKTKNWTLFWTFFVGAFGGHKFYLGQTGLGILYLLFCWTLIPAFIAFIELILFLFMSQELFDEKYNS